MEKALIKAYRDNTLSEASIKKYLADLKFIARVKTLTELEFLWDVDAVKERIAITCRNKPATDNTIRNRLTAILATIRVSELDEMAAPYKEMHDELSKKLKEIDYAGIKNEKQKEYFISKEDLAAKTKALKERAEGSRAGFQQKQDYMLWSLYTKITPRRNLDYWLMDIVEDDTDWRTLPEERNYLMLKERLFIYNQHKNTRYAKQKGIVEKISFKTNDEFAAILLDFIEYIPKPKTSDKRKILLCYKNGARWETTWKIGENLRRISGKRKFGANALRHIMAEHNSPSREALDTVAKMAAESGHDIKTHITKYIQKTSDN
jgi:hypothetical protein